MPIREDRATRRGAARIDQHRDHGVIPLAPQRNPIGDCEQLFRLFSCQPVSDANSDPAYALDSSASATVSFAVALRIAETRPYSVTGG